MSNLLCFEFLCLFWTELSHFDHNLFEDSYFWASCLSDYVVQRSEDNESVDSPDNLNVSLGHFELRVTNLIPHSVYERDDNAIWIRVWRNFGFYWRVLRKNLMHYLVMNRIKINFKIQLNSTISLEVKIQIKLDQMKILINSLLVKLMKKMSNYQRRKCLSVVSLV